MTVQGTIHGRFQPFHHGHLHYARLAFEECDELTVGLTNPDPSQRNVEEEDQNRHLPRNNPFTYWERYRIVKAVLMDDGFSAGAFNITPFNINEMDTMTWQHYMPEDARWFVRPKGSWGQKKVRRLRSYGLKVVELPFEEYTDISGTDIRRRLREGESWKHQIPDAGAEILEELCACQRLRNMQ